MSSGSTDPVYTTATLAYTLDNPNPVGTPINDFFGYAIAVSGNIVVVGARQEDDAGGVGSGKTYTYTLA